MAYTTISKSTDHFNTKLYTGNGSTNNITGVGFDSDFSWCKSRAVEVHEMYDKVRGAGKRIQSQSTAGENTEGYQSFITDGFAWSGSGNCNANGVNYVSWNWKANGQGSANSDGTITTTYTSANTTSGFSIVVWNGNGTNGSTIGHGLGATPKVVIVKCTSATENWNMYHEDVTSADNGNLYLNLQNAYAASGGNRWARSSISSSVFGLGSDGTTNQNGQTYIAYCFAEKTGFSKFGSYTGNGNANGQFIYTGFKPALVMAKRYDSGTEDWNVWDNKRIGYNVSGNDKLYWNLNSAESTTGEEIDILSNGFKWRTTNGGLNASGGTYLYMAFAEAPLVGSNNIPATAR